MKVTHDKTENCQAFLNIEMEPAEMEESMEKAYRRLVKKTDVPGFRRGKAPRAMLERYIGRESILKDALNSLIPEACDNAIKEQEIRAFAQPSVEITQNEPLVFKATVPLVPNVELGNYREIRMEANPAQIGEENINAVIDRIRHEQAAWEPVERAVDYNDLVILDIDGTADGKSLIDRKGVEYQVRKDQPLPVPGFADQICGMSINEEKEFDLHIPADFPKKEIADKEAHFSVKVIEVKQEMLPEADDEFARGVEPGFENMAKLKDHISEGLKKAAEERARGDLEERIIQAAVDNSKVEYPPFLIEMEIDRLLEQQLRRWQAAGHNIDDYLANINKTEEKLREELRPQAEKQVIRSLVLGKISQEEGIEVSDADVNAEIEKTAREASPEKQAELKKYFSRPEPRNSIINLLTGRKTVQRLVEIAGGKGKGEDDQVANTESEEKEGQQ